jgi:hypothetical protein
MNANESRVRYTSLSGPSVRDLIHVVVGEIGRLLDRDRGNFPFREKKSNTGPRKYGNKGKTKIRSKNVVA